MKKKSFLSLIIICIAAMLISVFAGCQINDSFNGSGNGSGNGNNIVVEVTGIVLSEQTLTLAEGETATLMFSVSPSDAADKSVAWSSSDADVASVSGGVVTAIKEGTVTITVTSANGKTAFCTVTVTAKTATKPEHTHEYKYVSDGAAGHHQECKDGDDVKATVAHNFDGDICSDCKYEKPASSEEPVTPPAHTHEYKYVSDGAAGHHQVCKDGDDVKATEAHNFVGNVCSDCKYEKPASSEEPVTPPPHTHEYKYVSDGAAGHHQECKDGDDVKATVAHNFVGDICSDCKYEKPASSEEPVTPPAHTHEYKYVSDGAAGHHQECKDGDDVKATVAHNFVGDICSDCKYEKRASSEEPVTPPAHTHEYKYVSDGAAGHHQECKDGDDIKATEAHNFVGNICSDCKYEKPASSEEPVTPPAHTHEYKYVSDGAAGHHQECKDGDDVKATEAHNFVGDICSDCKYEKPASSEEPVTPPEPAKYEVTFISNGKEVDTQSVAEGENAAEPNGVTNEGYTLKGWAIGSEDGDIFDFGTPVESALTLYAVWQKDEEENPDTPVTPDNPPQEDTAITYSYAGNESAAFEWEESKTSAATVQYKKSSETAYTNVDKQLIRDIGGGKARVDIVGLAGGVKYDFAINSSDGKTYAKEGVEIKAYDRSGYAHFGYSGGVGAYKDDGTLKSNAVVVYVTEATKNTVTAKIGNKTYTGIVAILQNAGTSTPLVVRIIGTVGAATWKKGNVTYTKTSSNVDKDNNLLPEVIVGANGKDLGKKSWEQADLISGGYNVLDTSVYSELKGLNSKIKWDSSKSEYDSCWNDCSIQNVKNVTVEGIGEDARLFQWGMTWKNCNSIEVRNLTFEDYTEDACSFEGSKTSASSFSDFEAKNFWIHHNTFEQGINYWDVCKEQDKHEGDGATDFKGLSNVTVSYNEYHDNHKTGLVGGSNSQSTANITFHHNYYNHCSSRLPLARQANMHMYNNYYYNTTGTNMSLRAGAYAFIENCYFDNANNPIVIEKRDSTYGIGAAKLLGNVFSGKQPASNDYLYKVTDRTKTVTNENKFSQNFDTNSSVFYYDGTNKKSDVAEMLTAEQVKVQIPKVAGVMKRGSGTVGGTAGGSGNTGNTGNAGDNTGNTGGSESAAKTVYVYTVENKQAATSSNAVGTIAVSGWKEEAGLTGSQISGNADDFRFDGNAYTVTITLNAKAGQKISVKLTGFSGSTGNAVGVNVEATNATMTSAGKTVEFSASSSSTAICESGTVEFTVTADGSVVITLKRSVAKTTRVTEIEVTVE